MHGIAANFPWGRGDPIGSGERWIDEAKGGMLGGEMPMSGQSRLSKSKYLAGRQCLKRLWLARHAPELGTPPDAARAALLEEGAAIGRHAHALFPGGVLVAEDAAAHDQAVARTQALLRDPTIPALFEAAFEHDGVRIRVDVLERLADGAWGLREVKSGTRVKDVHLEDVAVQRWVLEGCGVRLSSVELIQIDNTYVRDAGDIAWSRFFVRHDVADEVAARLPGVAALVREMHDTLAAPGAPVVEPSPHCRTPYRCEFWDHCTRDKPEDWIVRLPRLRATPLEALRAAGVERITDIPEDFPLRALQARVREVLKAGREFVSPDLGAALASLGPPADYLDFETMNPAIPLYPGTRPYERVPFQWSLHGLDAAGGVAHRAFLADGREDPRRAFAESLIATLDGTTTPILVYSSFEAEVLDELARTLPDHAGALTSIGGRLADLYAVVLQHVYHEGFGFSFSLKSVAPALVRGFGYDDLDAIAEGSQASRAFARVAAGGCNPGEEARIRRGLLAYCARDTQALIVLHRALRARAKEAR